MPVVDKQISPLHRVSSIAVSFDISNTLEKLQQNQENFVNKELFTREKMQQLLDLCNDCNFTGLLDLLLQAPSKQLDDSRLWLRLFKGFTPYHSLASTKHSKNVTACGCLLYIVMPKLLNVTYVNNRTPFTLAARHGNKSFMVFNQARNPKVINQHDGFNETALFVSSTYGMIDSVEFLLAQGANASTVFNNQNGISDSAVHTAAHNNHKRIVEVLLRHDPSLLTLQTENGMEPIHSAAHGNALSVLNFLLDMYGVDVDRPAARTSRTPLMFAAICDSRNAFNFLIYRRANLLATDYQGNNVFHLAILNNQLEFIKYLLDLEPVFKTRVNFDHEFPKQFALRNGKMNVAKWLQRKLIE